MLAVLFFFCNTDVLFVFVLPAQPFKKWLKGWEIIRACLQISLLAVEMLTCLCWCYVYKSLVEIMSHSTKKKCCLNSYKLADHENFVQHLNTITVCVELCTHSHIWQHHSNGFHNLSFWPLYSVLFSSFLFLKIKYKQQQASTSQGWNVVIWRIFGCP